MRGAIQQRCITYCFSLAFRRWGTRDFVAEHLHHCQKLPSYRRRWQFGVSCHARFSNSLAILILMLMMILRSYNNTHIEYYWCAMCATPPASASPAYLIPCHSSLLKPRKSTNLIWVPLTPLTASSHYIIYSTFVSARPECLYFTLTYQNGAGWLREYKLRWMLKDYAVEILELILFASSYFSSSTAHASAKKKLLHALLRYVSHITVLWWRPASPRQFQQMYQKSKRQKQKQKCEACWQLILFSIIFISKIQAWEFWLSIMCFILYIRKMSMPTRLSR